MDYRAGTLLFLSIAVIFAASEFVWRKRTGRTYDVKALGATMVIFVGQGLTNAINGIVIALLMFAAYTLSPFEFALTDWRQWAIGFCLVELAYYWQHRWNHTIRWMWATHAVHHSPNELVLPAAFRLGWTGLISGSWLVYLPVAALGIDPVIIGTLLVINLRYQYFLHTDLIGRLGPLEWIFNTPSSHRVHHSSREPHLDKNFGGILIVFDRLFGTYCAETSDVPVKYGLTVPLTTSDPFEITFHEWSRMFRDLQKASSLVAAWRILSGPPKAPGHIDHCDPQASLMLAE